MKCFEDHICDLQEKGDFPWLDCQNGRGMNMAGRAGNAVYSFVRKKGRTTGHRDFASNAKSPHNDCALRSRGASQKETPNESLTATAKNWSPTRHLRPDPWAAVTRTRQGMRKFHFCLKEDKVSSGKMALNRERAPGRAYIVQL